MATCHSGFMYTEVPTTLDQKDGTIPPKCSNIEIGWCVQSLFLTHFSFVVKKCSKFKAYQQWLGRSTGYHVPYLCLRLHCGYSVTMYQCCSWYHHFSLTSWMHIHLKDGDSYTIDLHIDIVLWIYVTSKCSAMKVILSRQWSHTTRICRPTCRHSMLGGILRQILVKNKAVTFQILDEDVCVNLNYLLHSSGATMI